MRTEPSWEDTEQQADNDLSRQPAPRSPRPAKPEELIAVILKSGRVVEGCDPAFTTGDGDQVDLRETYGMGVTKLFGAGKRVVFRRGSRTVHLRSDEIAGVEIPDMEVRRDISE